MFDFEKLEVYAKAKELHLSVRNLFKIHKSIPAFYQDQANRSSLSIVLNIAEGSGRISGNDKRHFYIIARGSVYETVAVLDLIFYEFLKSEEIRNQFYLQLETISKMLSGLIKSLEK